MNIVEDVQMVMLAAIKWANAHPQTAALATLLFAISVAKIPQPAAPAAGASSKERAIYAVKWALWQAAARASLTATHTWGGVLKLPGFIVQPPTLALEAATGGGGASAAAKGASGAQGSGNGP